MSTEHENRNRALEQVIAATQHARMLMFREKTLSEIDGDLGGLAAMIARDSLEIVYEAAIELLAMLPSDEFDRLTRLAEAQRRSA